MARSRRGESLRMFAARTYQKYGGGPYNSISASVHLKPVRVSMSGSSGVRLELPKKPLLKASRPHIVVLNGVFLELTQACETGL